ncbi:MAG: ADP-forming succinate--CoA ligase subunit beta, partial [Deltaproteobacteria bacterium]|nr:ADP-forming succinate--CoA ligase subunit beta [Deltaproteobacteria bacterium]
MNIHEYQAKEVLKKYNIAVLKSGVATSAQQAFEVATRLGKNPLVVKAQIHAGWRGKAGGVKLVKSPSEASEVASKLLGKNLVTHQSGPEGKLVSKVLIEEGCDIAQEYYIGLLLDRSLAKLAFMVSAEGGVEIEKLAVENPEKIKTLFFDLEYGLLRFQQLEIARFLSKEESQQKKLASLFLKLSQMFVDLDCSMVELNPLVQTKQDEFIALDAKISFDDTALFRHVEIGQMRDDGQDNRLEIEARRHNLNYVALDGSIACMVNGAGLAIATMDIIKLFGGSPANFLDVGGGATKETVEKAFTIILRDPKVKASLVNIFG